ncbi:MAG: TetR family transcriptional regulator [Myxococcales bacterium]|nr:MAG: TetR family transcriptional regulator [Myxococcales bacterium]
MNRDALLPAPGRGAYDRSLSRVERDAQHRERLLLAASEVLSEGPLTVARIAARAGVGRSTFYEFFDSPDHLLRQLELRVLRALEASLEGALATARTPLERVRAIARAWLTELEARPTEARVALTPRASADLLSPAGKVLHAALTRSAAAARGVGVGWLSATDDSSLLAAAAAVEIVTRKHLAGPAVDDAQRVLTELVAKLLR